VCLWLKKWQNLFVQIGEYNDMIKIMKCEVVIFSICGSNVYVSVWII